MKESVPSFEDKQHNIGLPTFKQPAITKHILRLNLLNIIFDAFSI